MIPKEASEAIRDGKNWDGEDGTPYLVVAFSTRCEAAIIQVRFLVAHGILIQRLRGEDWESGAAWQEDATVGTRNHKELAGLYGWETALAGALKYRQHAAKTGLDPLGLLTKPVEWEFQLKEKPDGALRVLRARRVGGRAWTTPNALPQALARALGVSSSLGVSSPDGTIKERGFNYLEPDDFRGTLERQEGVTWASPMVGRLAVAGGATCDEVRQAARRTTELDIVRIPEPKATTVVADADMYGFA